METIKNALLWPVRMAKNILWYVSATVVLFFFSDEEIQKLIEEMFDFVISKNHSTALLYEDENLALLSTACLQAIYKYNAERGDLMNMGPMLFDALRNYLDLRNDPRRYWEFLLDFGTEHRFGAVARHFYVNSRSLHAPR